MTPATSGRRAPDPVDAARRKLRGGPLARSFFGRVLNPKQVVQAVRLQMGRKRHRHTYDDAQLALYAQILPSEFLHFGYFDDPERKPEDVSLNDLTRAQHRYAELLLEHVVDRAHPALDVGCGMGGLSRMLRDRGFPVAALTPDRLQAAHVQRVLPDVPVLRTKLERLVPEEHAQKYGTVITSESLQYLKLDQTLPIIDKILRPGGKWVACDFFHNRPTSDRSLHVWDEFVAGATGAGWKLTYQRDVTPHIMPTLRFLHMCAVRLGMPLMQFAFLRLRRKQPGLHHLLTGVFEQLEGVAASNIEIIDPARFAADKRYVLLVLERA